MTTAIVPYRELNRDIWTMIQSVAPSMKESRLFGVATDAQAIAIMAKGFELGLSLTASFEFIMVIEGKPALIPRGALALILNSPMLEKLDIKDEKDGCTVTMKRKDGIEYTSRFTIEDAKKAGLVKDGSGWAKYPGNMARWRAIGFCADVVFPDVLGGLKRADELGADLTADGMVIEGSWTNGGSQPAPALPSADLPLAANHSKKSTPDVLYVAPATAPADPMKMLNDLIAKHGAEAVVVANQGKIPSTLEEIGAVALKLGGAL